MLFRQKLAFFVFGCVFVVVGQLVTELGAPPATAQGGPKSLELDELTVRSLRVIDATGRQRVQIAIEPRSSIRPADNAIVLYDTDGAPVMWLGSNPEGADLIVRSTVDEGMVHMQGGGGITVKGRAPYVSIQNPTGDSVIRLGRNDEHLGGFLSVNDDDGNIRVQASVSAFGGFLSVFGKGDDGARANLQVNSFGNGAIGTWDKNGYRQ